jgi:hypothetical protein
MLLWCVVCSYPTAYCSKPANPISVIWLWCRRDCIPLHRCWVFVVFADSAVCVYCGVVPERQQLWHLP